MGTIPGRLCTTIGGPVDIVHAPADGGMTVDWDRVNCPACRAHQGAPVVTRPATLRSVMLRVFIETDASDLDFANAADALETKLRQNGAKIGRAWMATDYPTEDGARAFWQTVESGRTKGTGG